MVLKEKKCPFYVYDACVWCLSQSFVCSDGSSCREGELDGPNSSPKNIVCVTVNKTEALETHNKVSIGYYVMVNSLYLMAC